MKSWGKSGDKATVQQLASSYVQLLVHSFYNWDDRLYYKILLCRPTSRMTRGSKYGLPSLCNDVMHYDIISVLILARI